MNKERYYLLTFNEDWADEHNVPALEVMTEGEFLRWSETRLSINAHLGNNGEYFMEDVQGSTGKELIDKGYVSKLEVSKDFAGVFEKAGLSSLSLSNVFDSDNVYEEEDEDEWEDDEEDDQY
jgi:hypothetical protein